MAEDLLRNINQIRRACAEAGYKRPHYDRLHRAIEERALPPRPGGGWSPGQVLRWAEATLQREVDPDPEAGTTTLTPAQEAPLAEARARAETSVKELQAQKLAFELDRLKGQYLPREEVALMLAERASVLKSGLLHLVRVNALEWAHLVGGKGHKVRDLAETIETAISNLLHEYAGQRHEVSFSQAKDGRIVAQYVFAKGYPALPADFLPKEDFQHDDQTEEGDHHDD